LCLIEQILPTLAGALHFRRWLLSLSSETAMARTEIWDDAHDSESYPGYR
jgi:hypothetical protein